MAGKDDIDALDGSLATSTNSSCTIVTTVESKRKTIVKQRIVIQLLTAALIVFLLLFVWQLVANLTRNEESKGADKKTVTSSPLFKHETRPCPYAPSQIQLPRYLPSTVKPAVKDNDIIFKTLTGLQSLEGMSANVLYRNSIVWKQSYGTKNVKASTKSPPDENTVFRVASVSKILTVLFVLKLLEKGQVNSLDDPLDKYEPRFQVINQYNSQKITLRHILSHTSGLPREAPCGGAWSRSSKYLCPVNTTYVLNKLKTTELKAPPGDEPNYSNLGYALLARILAQRFANDDYEEWVARNLLQSLGMSNSGFDLKRIPSNHAISYTDNVLNSDVDWGWVAPSFQLYSSAADLAKLMVALFDESSFTLIRNDLLQQLLTPNFVYPDGQTMFGLGWEMKMTGAYLLISKAGIVPGFSAGFILFPQLKLGATVLMSGREVAPSAAQLLIKPLAQRLAAYMIQQMQIQVPVNTAQYTGSYKLTSKWITNVHFNITFEENALQLHQDPGYPTVSFLSYLDPNVLELIYKPGYPCSVYGMGQNHERLVFDPPSDSAGRSPGFQFGPFLFVRTKYERSTRTDKSVKTTIFGTV